MSSPRSTTPSQRISPLPRLESYAHYSATQEKLWDGYDPATLAAREASIRARMVARARAREGGGGSDGCEEKRVMDGSGRLSVSSASQMSAESNGSPRSERSTSGTVVTPMTPKPPLKPLILASSAALVARSRTPVSETTTPVSTNTSSARRTLARQPSALELKYSPFPSSSSTTTPLRDGKSPTPRLSLSPARMDSWSRPSSDYLSPSTSSFGTSSRNAQTPSPSLLSPSYQRSSTSPLSKYFRDLPGREDARRMDVLDDEEEFRRLSTYLEDPYQRSTETSPVSSIKSRTSRRKGDVVVGDSRCGRGSGDNIGRSCRDFEGGRKRTSGENRGDDQVQTGTRSTSIAGSRVDHSAPPTPTRTNTGIPASPQAEQSHDTEHQCFRAHTPTQVILDDSRGVTCPMSPRSPRSPAWMWETLPLPPLPCEPPRKSNGLRAPTGKKGSLRVRMEVDQLPARTESLPMPRSVSPSVRSRASSETMSNSTASKPPVTPTGPVRETSAVAGDSYRPDSPTIPSSKPFRVVASDLLTSTARSRDARFSSSGVSPASTGRPALARSESATSAVSSLTDVGEVLETLQVFPAPPVRMTVQHSADDVESESARPPSRREQWREGEQYCQDRRPSASSTLTVVSDCATITSGYENQNSRRDSTPSLSLVRTTSRGSAGPKTPLFGSLDIQDDAQYGEVIDHQEHYFAARDRGTKNASRQVPATEELDDWGEIEILDSR